MYLGESCFDQIVEWYLSWWNGNDGKLEMSYYTEQHRNSEHEWYQRKGRIPPGHNIVVIAIAGF